MKKLLSLLMCYVLLQAETFALRGGPASRGNQLSGSYSGIMTETSGGSDLGLFLLNALSASASNGTVVVFEQNASGARFYSGTVTGLTNPANGEFTGLFNTTAQITTTFGGIGISTTLSLAGTIKLAISSAAGRGTAQQVSGTANAQSSGGGSLKKFSVTGWQTSADVVSGGFTGVNNSGG